jgi:hypothetical protein
MWCHIACYRWCGMSRYRWCGMPFNFHISAVCRLISILVANVFYLQLNMSLYYDSVNMTSVSIPITCLWNVYLYCVSWRVYFLYLWNRLAAICMPNNCTVIQPGSFIKEWSFLRQTRGFLRRVDFNCIFVRLSGCCEALHTGSGTCEEYEKLGSTSHLLSFSRLVHW